MDYGLYKQLVGIKQQLAGQDVAEKHASYKGVTALSIGNEEMDASSLEIARARSKELDDIVASAIDSIVLSSEGAEFTTAQIEAAKKIARLAVSPKDAMAAYKAPREIGVALGTEHLGVSDVVGTPYLADEILSAEAFDGQKISNALFFSLAFNLNSAKQDAFNEAFWPTVTIDPAVSGFTIETSFVSIMDEFKRDKSGESAADKFNKRPLIKNVFNKNVFGVAKNKLVPVYRTDSSKFFLADEVFVDETAGEAITTSYIAVGKTFNMLAISQTDAILAKGGMDNASALDRAIRLDQVCFSIAGKNASDEDVVERFPIDVSLMKAANFVEQVQGHHKDMQLMFDAKDIRVSTKSLTTKNAPSAILGALAGEYSVSLRLVMTGSANTETGDVTVYGNAIEVVAVRNSAGVRLAETSPEYLSVAGAFASVKIEGVTFDAYRTNSDLLTRGVVLTLEQDKQVYKVPFRTGFSILAPINNASGTDNDAAMLMGQIQAAGYFVNNVGVNTLVHFANFMERHSAAGTLNDLEIAAIGRHNVYPFYIGDEINMTDSVDSMRSTERLGDIRATLINRIRQDVLTAYTESNYNVAWGAAYGNSAVRKTVIIGTSEVIKDYLTGGESKFRLSDEFDAVVVSTQDELIKDQIICTFGVFSEDRNAVANPLNFGVCAWRPVITTDIVRTEGNVKRELQVNPSFLHVVNCPIMVRYNVSGISAVLGKVPALRKSV